jgi:CheY-like chemotaxis protein
VRTVLVVDDEPALRAVVRVVLGDEGYAVLEAPHGPAMLELLARERADLVLLDVMMPGGDGRAAYRELRDRADLPNVPVVMMSAAVRPDELDPSISAFLRKPFDLDHLLALVATLIGPSHADGPAKTAQSPLRRTIWAPATPSFASQVRASTPPRRNGGRAVRCGRGAFARPAR